MGAACKLIQKCEFYKKCNQLLEKLMFKVFFVFLKYGDQVGLKNKNFIFELACKLPPFSWLSHFRKHKAHLWDPPGSAAPGCHFFLQEIQRKFGKHLFFLFLPFIVALNKFKALGWLLWSFSRHPYTVYKCVSSVIADI